VRLRSAAHLADQAAGVNRHAAVSSPSVTRIKRAGGSSNAVPLEII